MKKLIASLTILATGAALASSVSSTATFGVLKITSDTEQTVISVPWVAAGSSDVETIKVKDFVKTSNLTKGTQDDGGNEKGDGDKLLVYVPSTKAYKGWYLASTGVWVGYPVSVGGNNYPADDDAALTRGSALILTRTGNIAQDNAIYLYGQYKASSSLEYTINREDGAALVSPVNTTGSTINLNSGVTWDETDCPKQGDLIKLHTAGGSAPTYRYDRTRTEDTKYWGRKVNGEWEEAVVQPGMGFWYTPVDDSGTTKFTLN